MFYNQGTQSVSLEVKNKILWFFSYLDVFMLETCQMISFYNFEASGIQIIFLWANQVHDVEIWGTGQLQ